MKKVYEIEGIPVEISLLDETGELERARLAALAFKEYEDSGALVSERLLEANAAFAKIANSHLLLEQEDIVD